MLCREVEMRDGERREKGKKGKRKMKKKKKDKKGEKERKRKKLPLRSGATILGTELLLTSFHSQPAF